MLDKNTKNLITKNLLTLLQGEIEPNNYDLSIYYPIP